MKNDFSPSQALLEISRGYSVFEINENIYYFKHFSIESMLELEEYEQVEFKKAQKNGIKTSKKLLEEAYKIGSWTKEKEEKLKSLQWTIKHSYKALNKIEDPIQRKAFEGQISEQEAEIATLEEQKNKISGFSAETLAQQKKVGKMLKKALYYDKEFKKRLEEKDLVLTGALVFAKFAELATKENLLKASYLSHFFEVFIASANPVDLFKADFRTLTIFQKGLISYSKSLHNKMQNTQIPSEIAGDPVKIYNYEEPKDKEEGKSEGIDDIKRKMQARGGQLKAEDLLA